MFLIVASSLSSEQNVLNIGNNIFFPSGITQSRSASPVVRLPTVVSPGVPTSTRQVLVDLHHSLLQFHQVMD